MSDIAARVKQMIVEHLKVDEAKVTETASFADDLGTDSLDLVEMVMNFESEFDIEIPEKDQMQITTVGSAINYITAMKAA